MLRSALCVLALLACLFALPVQAQQPVADAGGGLAAFDAARHRVAAAEGGHVARNPGQRWLTRFDGRGFVTAPEAGGWTWGLELAGYGWVGAPYAVAQPQGVVAAGQRLSYRWDERLTEWFVNDRRGLEHGFTVNDRPADAQGALVLSLTVRGELLPVLSANGRDVHFVDAAGGSVLNYAGLTVVDADGCDLAAGFRLHAGGLELRVDDQGARYPLTIDPVAQQAYLKASNAGFGDNFGSAVVIDGDTAVVTAPLEDGPTNNFGDGGAAYVFVRSGGVWIQQALLRASNLEASDFFGYSADLSGDTIVVGAHREDSAATGVDGDQASNASLDSGAAYVFVRNGTVWTQQAYLKASNTGADDVFGWHVAVDGDTIAVGAYQEDSTTGGINSNQADNSASNAGAVYVFVRNGTTWSQQAYLKSTDMDQGDYFGWAVDVSGDTVIVGSWREDSASTGVNGDQLSSLAGDSGAAFVFVRSGVNWSQQAYLKASNTGSTDWFGRAVAISGDTALVGAVQEDSAATGVDGNQASNAAAESGAAYVFVRNGGGWSQQAYLKASNTGAGDMYAESLSVSGDTIVVGAFWERSNATGVDGNQLDNSVIAAGAAYVYTRSGSTWSQLAYLKASNTGSQDEFGVAVSVSGATALVGARFEDSNGTGVNGNQNNNLSSNSGAAYIFDLDLAPNVWTDLGFALAGVHGDPLLVGDGSLLPGSAGSLTLSNAAGPGALAVLFSSFASTPAPFKGGTLVPVPVAVILSLATAGNPGGIVLPWASWPAGYSGLVLYFQYGIADVAGPMGVALSNAVRANVP